MNEEEEKRRWMNKYIVGGVWRGSCVTSGGKVCKE